MNEYTYKKPEEKWVVAAKKADFAGLAKEIGLEPVTVRLMVNRGAGDLDSIKAYLYDGVDQMHDPSLMKDMDKAANIIEETILSGKPIVISADYDADGIFSGELLYEALSALGATVNVKTPHRVKEGYGMNDRIVGEAAAEGAALIITCDNGISSFDAVKKAKELGITCVITDHHEVAYDEIDGEKMYKLPEAAAIVDPHQADCGYPFKNLCGCGVALKLVTLIYNHAGLEVPDIFYQYAAIATVADVMPLNGENRIIVREGLKRLRTSTSEGLEALIRLASMDRERMNSGHIGFVVGPRFNAAGRLDTVEPAVELLRAKSVSQAETLAENLNSLNEKRKELTEVAAAQAIDILESTGHANDKILLVALENCHESIAGIVAGRIKERYNKPAFVFTRTETCFKGSGRSIPAYHMYQALTSHKDFLLRFGGHSQAAGLSVPFDLLEEFREALNRDCQLTEEDFKVKVVIDAPVPLEYLSEKLIEELDVFEPVGTGNDRPLFAEKHFTVNYASIIGKNRNVLKLRVTNATGCSMDALLFGGAEEFASQVVARYGQEEWEKALDRRVNSLDLGLTYVPAINEYMGQRTIQIQIQNYLFN